MPMFIAGGKFADVTQAQDDIMHKLESASIKAEKEGKVIGRLMYFGVADGHATYLVVKERPLTLQHVPYGDAWHIPGAHVRGIRVADVRQQRTLRSRM